MSRLAPHFHASSSDVVDYTSMRICRQPFRVPCRARCLSHQHNRETAYIEIPRYAPHGMLLQCSHKECSQSGRRFRYCYVCKRPVSKRNFIKRHGHGMDTNIQGEEEKAADACRPCNFRAPDSLEGKNKNEVTQSSESSCPLSHLINRIFDAPALITEGKFEDQFDIYLSGQGANDSSTNTEYDWGPSRRHYISESGMMDDGIAAKSTLIVPTSHIVNSHRGQAPSNPMQMSKHSGQLNIIPSSCDDIYPSMLDLTFMEGFSTSNSNSMEDCFSVETFNTIEYDTTESLLCIIQENYSDTD